jgi:uncharacterized protein
MLGRIAALYRHPVKGFTPEALTSADLRVGEAFPCDRLYAVENGPSGFDPEAPAFVPKQKFAVLAAVPQVAKARTAYDEASATLTAETCGRPPFQGRLDTEAGRAAFAAWLEPLVADHARGPLRVVHAGGHRFMDHPLGHVSVINLTSVRDLAAKLGREVDPLRFRANVYVDGWPAWVENDWPANDGAARELKLGAARVSVFKPIVRCVATHVDPVTGVRDMEVVKALFDHFGHMHCGVYVHVQAAARIASGDPCPLPES